MMERQGDSQVCMMVVDLDKFVPATHLLRQVKSKVDFTFIYDKVKHLYKPGGRPAEPVLLVKMWLIGYMYNITSERRLEQEVNMNLAYRWFLGIPLDERVPDHSTLSNNRNGRFRDGTLFLDVFEGIVEQCKQAGLIQGKAVVTDSTHAKRVRLLPGALAPQESTEIRSVRSTRNTGSKPTSATKHSGTPS